MTQTIKPAPVRKTLTVAASPQRAFEVFTAGFDRWWPRSHTIGAAALKTAIIEPRQGGRWYGIDVDGGEDEWGDVLAWEPPTRLVLAWRIGADWKYDKTRLTEVEVNFTALADGKTRVDFEHRLLENLGAPADAEAGRANLDSPGGWGGLLDMFAAEAAKA
jgi:uncharacterized protein YndB with AHSA1/START domain